jgi:RND family efflux transporter MFP subunit
MVAERFKRWHHLLIMPPIVLGLVIFTWLTQHREPLALAENTELARSVRVIAAPLVKITPTAVGYGIVQPARSWTAISQVSGIVVQIHPLVHDGEVIPAGTELIQIDPTDYELALAHSQAKIAELDVQRENSQALLTIQERTLLLAQQHLERNQQLLKQDTISQSVLDDAERNWLTIRATVQSLKNTLALIAAQRKLLETTAAQVARDLEHTLIRAPFALRIANRAIETHQYVTLGQALLTGDAIDQVDITAQMPMSAMRRLVLDQPQFIIDIMHLKSQIAELIDLKSIVSFDLGHHRAQWPARFVRFDDQIDPATRTLGVVVAVDNPFKHIELGKRPPLWKNMFVQVELTSQADQSWVVVPRNAIRNAGVYSVDADQRLRYRPVQVLYSQDQISVIQSGIDPGELVIVSDPVPATEGMLLKVQQDDALQQALQLLGQQQS